MQRFLGNNSNIMKQRNRALILNMIKEEGGISRAELSKRTASAGGHYTDYK